MIISAILIIISYLMGSICSAVLVCRTFNLPDPRTEGSKNPGATNVLRLAGKQYALLVLLVDVLKGTIPVVIAKGLGAPPYTISLCVLAAVLGHIYPVFFGFKGGKGVATAIGALLGFHFVIGVMVIATWLLVANFFRYSSLASLIAIILAPFYTLFLTHQLDILFPLFCLIILVAYKHKNNITRLMDGSEPHIVLKSNLLKEVMHPGEKKQASQNHVKTKRASPSKAKITTKKTTVKKEASTKKRAKKTEE